MPPPTGTAAGPTSMPQSGHASGKKLSQHAQNTPKSAYFRLLGEFFRGLDQNPLLLGEIFRAHEHPRDHPTIDRYAHSPNLS